ILSAAAALPVANPSPMTAALRIRKMPTCRSPSTILDPPPRPGPALRHGPPAPPNRRPDPAGLPLTDAVLLRSSKAGPQGPVQRQNAGKACETVRTRGRLTHARDGRGRQPAMQDGRSGQAGSDRPPEPP